MLSICPTVCAYGQFAFYRESSQHPQYLRVNLGESNTGASFPVDQSPQSGFALDDAVWHSHLAAESWQEDDQLKSKGACCITEGEHRFIPESAWAVAIAQC